MTLHRPNPKKANGAYVSAAVKRLKKSGLSGRTRPHVQEGQGGEP